MIRNVFISAILTLLYLLAGNVIAMEVCVEPIQTTEGPVVGIPAADGGSCAYLGIPYAAPPVGDLRFKAPHPPEVREGVFNAHEFSPSCIQDEHISSGGKSESFSEDCLTLNIWRPVAPGKYPVMYWIHGGGYVQGASNYAMYNGANLAAKRGVVVVSVNYRLGLLGFLALEELAAEDENGGTGNYGLLDQIQGLAWIKNNIAAFGGDPENVTIFGHSAGGVSVCNIMASPLARGMFHKAILQSGACDMVADLENGYARELDMARELGCEGDGMLDCLRAKPARKFKKQYGVMTWAHVDGHALKAMPIEAIRSDEYNKTPLVVGSTFNEMDLMLLFMPPLKLVSQKTIEKKIREIIPKLADKILELYPFSEFKRPIYLALKLLSDGFASRAYQAAEATSKDNNVYMYRVDWRDIRFGKTTGAFHGIELPLVFGNLRLPHGLGIGMLFNKKKVRKSAEPLSEKLMSYWTNFAKTGNPNGEGLEEWPKYSTSNRKRIIFNNTITVQPITDKDLQRYDFFSGHTIEEMGFTDF